MYHDREKHGKRIKTINNKLYLSTEKKRWRKNMKVLGISFGRKKKNTNDCTAFYNHVVTIQNKRRKTTPTNFCHLEFTNLLYF